MKQFILTYFYVIGLSTFLSAQSSVRLYGTCERSELVTSIDVDSAGYQYVLNEYYVSNVLALSKISPTHEMIWTKTLELDSVWQQISAGRVMCFDSSIFISGIYFHNDTIVGDYGWRTFLARYTNNGELLWFKNLDKFAYPYILSNPVLIKKYGDKLIYTNPFQIASPTSHVQPNICCLDDNGNVLWSKYIENGLYITDIQTASDSSIFCLGIFPTTSGIKEFFLIKISITGDIIWQKSYSPQTASDDFRATSLSLSPNGDLFISGIIYQQSINSSMSYFGRLNSNTGDFLFSKMIEIPDYLFSDIKVISKNGLHYLVGLSRIHNDYSIGYDINLTKIDDIGTIEWMYTYNDPMNVSMTNNQLMVDAVFGQNTILTIGNIANYGAPHLSGFDIIHTEIRTNGEATHKKDTLYPNVSDYPLVPFDTLTFSNGFSSDTLLTIHEATLDFHLDFSSCELSTISVDEVVNDLEKFSVYPNPAIDVLTIVCPLDSVFFTLTDMTGRVLLKTKEKSIDVRKFTSGYYFLSSELGHVRFYKE